MRTKPKLGQNFLVSPSACAAIVAALPELSARTVVEIGPGRGAITDLLAHRAGRLIAVELDRELAPALAARYASQPLIRVLQQDILCTSLADLAPQDSSRLLVIGNLPYYITSDILLHLLRFHAQIETAVLMVQSEVADRVAARPGSRDYGVLSATVQLYARVEKILTLPPEAFSPPPEVYSTVLRLSMAPRLEELQVDAAGFVPFLRQCFSQKRKTLVNNLRAAGLQRDQIERALESSGIGVNARAEAVTLAQSAELYRALREGRVY